MVRPSFPIGVPLTSTTPAARRIDGGFPPAFAGRQIDVEQMELVVARADLALASMTKPRLATLPSSTSTASEPMCSQMRCRAAAARQRQGRDPHPAAKYLARARRIAIEQSRHLRSEQHLRSARRGLARTASINACAFAAGSMPVVDWRSAMRVMRASSCVEFARAFKRRSARRSRRHAFRR